MLITCDSIIGIVFEDTGIYITATNIGNRNIFIKNLGIKVKKNIFTNIKIIEESRIMLKPRETTTQYFWNFESSAFSKVQ